MGGGNYMANTKDAYMKWKEQGLLETKLKIISDYYSYKEARGLIYNLLGVSEATWERLKKRHEELRFTIAEAKKLHEQLLLVSITRRAEGEYYEDTQTIIEESNGKTKKKIVKIKKYIPGDVGAGKYLLSRLHGEKYNENKEMLEIARKRQESNFEEWNVNENKKSKSK
jgi:hypothetical protein